MTSLPQYVDIGVNFHSPQLKGLAGELVHRAKAAGVGRILATGTSVPSSRQAVVLSQSMAGVFATAGIHPHSAKDCDPEAKRELEVLWGHDEVVAVGECGLDFNRMFSPANDQRRAFQFHLEGAVRTGKPLFLHCRDAFDDFHAMVKDAAAQGAKGVVHCFTGTPDEAQAFLALGYDLGITGWVSDPARGHSLREAVKGIPLERLHLETDAPYLRPRNAGRSRNYNEPALLPFVAQSIAELKGVSEAEVAEHATRNSERMFRLAPTDFA